MCSNKECRAELKDESGQEKSPSAKDAGRGRRRKFELRVINRALLPVHNYLHDDA